MSSKASNDFLLVTSKTSKTKHNLDKVDEVGTPFLAASGMSVISSLMLFEPLLIPSLDNDYDEVVFGKPLS
jgi:hypothetical protein